MTEPVYRKLRDSVWERARAGGLTTTQLVVALRLVEHFPNIFPGEKTLAAWTQLGESTVRAALRELEERMIVRVQRTPGKVNHYEFLGRDGQPIRVGFPDVGPPIPRQQLAHTPPAASAHPASIQRGTPPAASAEADLPKQPLKQEMKESAFARPQLMYKFPKGWNPKDPRHRDEGKLLGLTSQDVQRRAFECRNKDYPHGFSNADDQFSRELSWAARDKETRNFKANPHGLDEKPGRFRKPDDPRPPTVFGAIAVRRP